MRVCDLWVCSNEWGWETKIEVRNIFTDEVYYDGAYCDMPYSVENMTVSLFDIGERWVKVR